MRHTGKARVAGVMGWPVSHSLSPRLHGHWFERYAVDGVYIPLPVHPDQLATALRALPCLGFRGVNVTIPHKERAFALVDTRDEAAERTGVVNTVLVGADGALHGLATDGVGFMANLLAEVPTWRPDAGPAVLVGTGGAARAVAVALLDAGVPGLRLVNRTRAKAATLARALALWTSVPVQALDWEERHAALGGAGLAVNTSSLGMAGQPPLDLALDGLPRTAVVADLVYVPLETPLLAAARARGHAVVGGLGMLLHQAVPGFTHWGGVTPVVDATLRDHMLAALKAR